MDDINEHLKLVSKWLDENVRSYPTPSRISLAEFDFNWDRMTGEFCLFLDEQCLPDPFHLTLSQNGWMQFHPPMFVSPLGAPASFRAVNLTSDTELAIDNALHQIFPRLKPLGLDKQSGLCIWSSTPIADRIIDIDIFHGAKLLTAQPGYSFDYQL
jgi:hypothetical protein